MYPERSVYKQTGAGLPVALFVITVLALLVIGMAQLQESSGKAISLQIQSQRAFFAAESGAQLAVAEVLDSGDCSGVPAVLDFTVGALRECRALLVCSASDPYAIGGSGGDRVLTIVSTGQCGGGEDLATRRVEVRVR